jgi:hypothetical protein
MCSNNKQPQRLTVTTEQVAAVVINPAMQADTEQSTSRTARLAGQTAFVIFQEAHNVESLNYFRITDARALHSRSAESYQLEAAASHTALDTPPDFPLKENHRSLEASQMERATMVKVPHCYDGRGMGYS